ncbi:MAG TPA: glycoside hydrolase family 127 protein [Candidatus Hydrogenedens sp.]|nr:glycoside hydrolase family 127 protein [Candidatus Hydrogenedens sp.]
MKKKTLLVITSIIFTQALVFADQNSFYPRGELEKRVQWVQDRFDFIHDPAYTDSFILQDIKLSPDTPRRFQEFSGDISGRFLEVISLEPRGDYHKAWSRRIAQEIIKYQKEDGRFGNPDLVFTKDQVGRDHMALLWGNGRLLVGLISYYQINKDPAILEACKKMGDFFIAIFEECSQPDVIKRLEKQGANGFICFTQWSEGLELLARATGDNKYRETAKKMEPLLQPPINQHSHGYITTLRGDMLIWESTKDPEILARNEKRFNQLVEEGWVKANGGVPEYFNKTYPRDEGCSEADLFRWCLQLWKATEKIEYLEYAERCLFNSLFSNQFETGDFGHHTFDSLGYVSSPGPGRAWWCCTMHGLRALHDLKQCVINTPTDGKIQINLFLSGEYYGKDFVIKASRLESKDGAFEYDFDWLKTPTVEWALTIRHPYWAETVEVAIDNKPEFTSSEPGTVMVKRVWEEKNKVKIKIQPIIRFVNTEIKEIPYEQLSNLQKVAIFVGPWLMGINAVDNPMFHGEPYSDNIILLPNTLQELKQNIIFTEETRFPLQSGPHLTVTYKHSGFSEPCKATFTPVSERSRNNEATFTFWHNIQKQ